MNGERLPERAKIREPGEGAKDSYEGFGFERARIEKVVVENPKVRSFYLKVRLSEKPDPGQFVMVWLPASEEVPMSVSGADGNRIRISVSEEGRTTTELHKLERGDSIFVRGPFGKGFSLEGNSYLLVGGGYGAAPLIFAVREISGSGSRGVYAIGAKNSSELLFLKEARRRGIEVRVATEDGSVGERGPVTDLSDRLLSKGSFDSILTCGPERMMYEVVRQGMRHGVPVQASLERYMKCGFGICGSCVLDPLGLRVCVDGPVFGGKLLKTEFGKFKRDASGKRVPV